MELPEPRTRGRRSLEQALTQRRSNRELTERGLSRATLGQLLWAAQGITQEEDGFRTAPSAGATYPLELYAVTADGVFHYAPREHALRPAGPREGDDDVRRALQRSALGQDAVGEAPVVLIIAAVYSRTERRYGRRAERYVHMEAGHAAQNVLLQATVLELGAVPIGAFEDEAVRRAVDLPRGHRPLYLLLVGHPVRPG